jgi:PAS domain S-box-containing protein
LRGYLIAVVLVSLATWLKYLAQPLIIPTDVPILYFLAIIPTAIFFGFGPAILVCILSLLGYDYFFIPPLYQISFFEVGNAPILVIFLIVGILFSYLASNLRRKNEEAVKEITARKQTEADLEDYRDHLEDLIRQRTEELEEANLELQLDISERKKGEEELRQSGERLKRSQEIAHLGSWELDLVNGYLSWSDEVYRIFGVEPQEFGASYEAFLDAVHPDDRAAVDMAYSSSVKEGRDSYEIEHRITRKSTGEIRYVHEKCRHIRDGSGKIMRSIGMVHDITERKLAEEQVNRAVKRRQLLLELSTQIVAEKSAEGILARVANAVRTMTEAHIAISAYGFVNGQFIISGISQEPGYPPRQSGRAFLVERGRACMDMIQARESIRLTSEQLPKHPLGQGLVEGNTTLKGLLGVRLFNVGGKANGLIMVSGKVSGEFTDENETLVKQIATITSLALQHVEALNFAEARATELEVSNKELEAFAYSVSHDLRAPLRSIDGFSDAILEEYGKSLDERGKDYLNRIRDSSQMMAQLIDDLLGLSRVVRTEIVLKKVDLSGMAKAISQELKKSEPQRQVEFDIADGVEAIGDGNLLHLVLENLFNNAFKFTSGCQIARISFGLTEKNREKIYYIKDNGAGFDMKYADKLFKPFQRLHPANEFPGTGIGLATVQRIIRRHGGKVWAEGKSEKGATFYFTIREDNSPT